jgi:predicted transposase/invertase (TIGR01784 family)
MIKKLIKFDWALKKLLRSKSNFDILEGFLSELLKDNIKILEILESEGNKENDADKFNRVDLLVKNKKGEIIIIEVQNRSEIDYFQRILYGTSKVITEYISEGKPYKQIKKVISVNIVYFNIGVGKDYIYHGTTVFKGLHHENEVLELSANQKKEFKRQSVQEIFPQYYILKVNNFDDIAKNTLDEWIYFLKNAEVRSEFKAKGIKAAIEKLNVMKLSPEDQIAYKNAMQLAHSDASWLYDIEVQVRAAREEAKKEAKQEAKQAKIEMVIKLATLGVAREIIAASTNLSADEINKILDKK